MRINQWGEAKMKIPAQAVWIPTFAKTAKVGQPRPCGTSTWAIVLKFIAGFWMLVFVNDTTSYVRAASLAIACPKCGYAIPPAEIRRVSSEHMRCRKCAAVISSDDPAVGNLPNESMCACSWGRIVGLDRSATVCGDTRR